MNALNSRYSWEAIDKDSNIINQGEFLDNVVKFSLIPSQGVLLPRHDLVGVEMKRRFCRGFILGTGGGLREYLHCVVCKGFRWYVSCSNGAVLVTPEDFELYI